MNGDKGYSLLYLSKQTEFAQNLPTIQQMVSSFKIGCGNAAAISSSGGPVATTSGALPLSSQPECVPGYHWDASQLKCVAN